MKHPMKAARRAATLTALLAAMGTVAPAANAAEIPFTGWTVKGDLTVAKLNQKVILPPGSRFDGVLETTTQQLTGHVAVPAVHHALHGARGARRRDARAGRGRALDREGRARRDHDDRRAVRVRDPYPQAQVAAAPAEPGRAATAGRAPRWCSRCTTAGRSDFAKGFKFTGTTTIPSLTGCGLATPLLNDADGGAEQPVQRRDRAASGGLTRLRPAAAALAAAAAAACCSTQLQGP